MSWFGKIFGAGTTQVIDAVGRTGSVFFGDKAGREDNEHGENMAIHNQHAAEYQYRGRRTWFDSLIDGLNRSVRPGVTYGIFVLFGWAAWGAKDFLEFTARLATIPEPLWIVMGTVLAFWFGSRSIFKDKHAFKPVSTKHLENVYKATNKIRQMTKSAADESIEELQGTGNKTLDAFNVTRKAPKM